MRILITGGAGFIGSNLIGYLIKKADNEIVCVDNFDDFYSVSQKQANILGFVNEPNFLFVECDILYKEEVKKLPIVDVIIHLAAKTGVRSSMLTPLLYQSVNVGTTKNMLEFARTNNIKQFIFSSSSSIYGENPNIPWTEEEVPMPISPYAVSKLDCEALGFEYSSLYSIRFIALRFFTVFGPAQRPDLAIYKFFYSIINERPLHIFGDGLSVRNYSYVDDIILGINAAISYEESNCEIINLSGERSLNLLELIRLIENICEKKAIIHWADMQCGDVLITNAKIDKANKLLKYYPTTDIRTGLSKFYEWFKSSQRLE